MPFRVLGRLAPPLPNPLDVVRAPDLAVLRFRFTNLRLTTLQGQLRLVRKVAAIPALVLVELPPQAFLEPILQEASDTSVSLGLANSFPTPPLAAAGLTRLAFQLPETVKSLPWALSALLAWEAWEPVVSPYARRVDRSIWLPGEPLPDGPPPDQVTAVELPFRLFLSGDELARWQANAFPVGLSGRTELWHARLAATAGKGVPVRAVGRRIGTLPAGFADNGSALTAEQRDDLVARTIGPDDPSTPPAYGPVRASQLAVSALGGWLGVAGVWAPGADIGVVGWRHSTTSGRDQAVRVVTIGRLLPFGHRAALISLTERRIVGHGDARAAWLVKQSRLVVLEPVRSFPKAGSADGTTDDRLFPLRQVRMLTTSTPPVDIDTDPGWPLVGPEAAPRNFLFKVLTTDASGRNVTFTMPMRFVAEDDDLAAMAAGYNSDQQGRFRVNGRAQELALSEPQLGTETPVYPIQSVNFGVIPKGPVSEPPQPVLRAFTLHLPAAARLNGTAKPHPATYATDWTQHKGDALVRLLDPQPVLDFSNDTQRVGALAAPSYSLDCVRRSVGLVPQLAGGDLAFNPATVLGDSKLLGGLFLRDLIGAGAQPPMLVDVVNANLPRRTKLSWVTPLQGSGVLAAGPNAQLTLNVDLPEPGSGVPNTVEALLTGISFEFGAIAVNIATLSYTALEGSPPTVGAALADPPVRFSGPLEFLDRLRQLLPADGFANPPAVTVDGTGIRAGYDLALPDVAIGAFAVQELSLSAGLSVPFTGEPTRVRFALARRDAPFRVAVSAFTGGGSVAVALGLDGIQQLEASLEFGGAVELDVGVASGGVVVVGGLALAFSESSPGGPGEVHLTAYVRATGAMEFLGLVALSVEVYIALDYRKQSNGATSLWGTARQTVEIEVAFFSKSVSFTVQREFAGSSADPDMHQSISEDEFLAYAAAFADD